MASDQRKIGSFSKSLVASWRSAPRRWGHRFHSMCSYMAMFPPSIPHVFIDWLTAPGDVVYDPFAGRGTTPLEACLMGRTGQGSDANPLAWILTSAKVDPPAPSEIKRRLRELRSRIRAMSTRDEPDHIRMLFTPKTLGQLLWLRVNLNQGVRTDRFLLAVLLGILHANADLSGRPRGLTVAMPNTFSMSPGYVARYIRDHGLVPPEVNVLDLLESRIEALGELPREDFSRGKAWLQDATTSAVVRNAERAKLVFTSPPYLHVILYGKFNWLRLWLLGLDRREVDGELFTSSSLKKYLQFMTATVAAARNRMRDDGFMCLVIGDVRDGKEELNLAGRVARVCAKGTDLRPVGIVTDRLPEEHKVSRIWGETKGQATRTDRILMLAGPDAKLPRTAPAIAWQ
jgi:hypothetical protein